MAQDFNFLPQVFERTATFQRRFDGEDLEGVTVCTNDSFPYLDMEFYWSDDNLLFQVHMKPNQQVKYLNQGSTHRKDVFKAIPSGVMGRLAKLTSQTEENGDVRIDILYPEHATALSMSDLSPTPYPTLWELQTVTEKGGEQEARRMKKDRVR